MVKYHFVVVLVNNIFECVFAKIITSIHFKTNENSIFILSKNIMTCTLINLCSTLVSLK